MEEVLDHLSPLAALPSQGAAGPGRGDGNGLPVCQESCPRGSVPSPSPGLCTAQHSCCASGHTLGYENKVIKDESLVPDGSILKAKSRLEQF